MFVADLVTQHAGNTHLDGTVPQLLVESFFLWVSFNTQALISFVLSERTHAELVAHSPPSVSIAWHPFA